MRILKICTLLLWLLFGAATAVMAQDNLPAYPPYAVPVHRFAYYHVKQHPFPLSLLYKRAFTGFYPAYAIPMHPTGPYLQHSLVRKDSQYVKGFWIGTNVMSAMEDEIGPSLTLEYRANVHWAFSASYKVILGSWNKREDPDQHPYYNRGYRFTADVKYFLPNFGHHFRWFVGLEGMYKQVDYTDWIDHKVSVDGFYAVDNTVNASLLQPERTEPRSKQVWAVAPVLGIQRFLGAQHRFQVEFMLGLGVRYRTVNTYGAPSAAGEWSVKEAENQGPDGDPFRIDANKNGAMVHVPMSIRFAYRLGGHR